MSSFMCLPLQDTTVALRQWHSKTDCMWEKAQKVVPVHKRTAPVAEPTVARSLCDYSTKDVS